MDRKPILAITVGDPSGIGPEIVLKALRVPAVYEKCTPILIGDLPALESAARILPHQFTFRRIATPREARGQHGIIEYIGTDILAPGGWTIGQVCASSGEAAFSYIKRGIDFAMAGMVDAVVTGPINKEALNLAGHHFSGHTELFSYYTGTRDYAMLLVSRTLRVLHVTTHLSMRDACDAVTKERVLKTIRLAAFSQKLLGLSGAIAVAGLNAHCSENGLFGFEEAREIRPAVEQARAEGIAAEGPIPPDTVFVKASAGKYDLVVAMYHDQGHIPLKLSGFRIDPQTGEFVSAGGINCTIGLPIIRTSVDHGTAFDCAGRGIANEESLLDAIEMAVTMSSHLDLIKDRFIKSSGGIGI